MLRKRGREGNKGERGKKNVSWLYREAELLNDTISRRTSPAQQAGKVSFGNFAEISPKAFAEYPGILFRPIANDV